MEFSKFMDLSSDQTITKVVKNLRGVAVLPTRDGVVDGDLSGSVTRSCNNNSAAGPNNIVAIPEGFVHRNAHEWACIVPFTGYGWMLCLVPGDIPESY